MSTATATMTLTPLMPVAPRTLADAGLSQELVLQLLLKHLHFGADFTGQDLARRVGLEFTVIEPVLEPELPICDPHHHLWDKASARLQERYLIDEMLDDIGSHNVVSTVFIECSAFFKRIGPDDFRCVGETEAVNGIAAMCASGIYGETEIAKGIVGHVDLTRGDVIADVLDAQIAAGGGRFRRSG